MPPVGHHQKMAAGPFSVGEVEMGRGEEETPVVRIARVRREWLRPLNQGNCKMRTGTP